MIHISKRIIIDLSLIILVGLIVVVGTYLFNGTQEVQARIIVIGTFCVLVTTVWVLYKRYDTFFNPVILFLLSFYVFQNGQLLLSALKIPFQDYYYRIAGDYIYSISLFSSYSAILACIASIICGEKSEATIGKRVSKIDRYDTAIIGYRAFVTFLIIGCAVIPLTVSKIPVAISGGYDAIRIYESGIHPVLGFLDFLFIPFLILTLIFDKNRTHRTIILLLGGFYIISTLFFGDRTTAIAGIIVIFNIRNNWIKKGNKGKSFFKFMILAVLIFFVIFLAGVIRDKDSVGTGSPLGIMISSFSELGFSFFPLYTMMKIIPSVEGYMFGKGYLASLIGGFLPAFLDPSGTVAEIDQYALIYQTWQAKYFPYNFGLGFSLNAEAYANFGWYGLIVVFLLCLFIFRLLNKSNGTSTSNSPFNFYIGNIMLFLIFTLPRRGTYTLWNSVSYGIVFIYLFIVCFCKRKGKL